MTKIGEIFVLTSLPTKNIKVSDHDVKVDLPHIICSSERSAAFCVVVINVSSFQNAELEYDRLEGDCTNPAGSMVRLESRMQDYIRTLMPSAKVGYTVSLL